MKFNDQSLNEFIFVGDLHVKKENIEESIKFTNWLYDIQNQLKCPIVFSGDQYHDHGVARVEVFDFWDRVYKMSPYPTISLIGNHDIKLDDPLSFMKAHELYTLVIDKPTVIGDFLLLPFYRKNEDFIDAVNGNSYKFNSKFIICHQEFNGCKYDNGFFSPNGIDPKLVENRKLVICGHIHTAQEFSNIWYPGTPRHLTRSDINCQKYIYIIKLEANGELTRKAVEVPDTVCEPYKLYTISEGSDIPKIINDSSKVYVDITGSDNFIKKVLKNIPENVKVRTFPTQSQEIVVKESEGIDKAFLKYAESYFNDKNINEETAKTILSIIFKKCPSITSN